MILLNNKNVTERILTKIQIVFHSKTKLKVWVILSLTVNARLEPESKTSDFEKERKIGKGGFELVWK